MKTVFLALAAIAMTATSVAALPTSTSEFTVTTTDVAPGTDVPSPDDYFGGRTRGGAKPSPVMDMFGYDEFGKGRWHSPDDIALPDGVSDVIFERRHFAR